MKHRFSRRLLALFLAFAMFAGVAPAAYATGETSRSISFAKTELSRPLDELVLPEAQADEAGATAVHDPDEILRVSIILEKKPVLSMGYSTMGLSANQKAMTYRNQLESQQQAVQAKISATLGADLDVAWNLTLAVNAISADVRCGDLEKIAAVEGVAAVVPETRYVPCEAEEAVPNMATATGMTGSDLAWLTGYTGAGTRIAVIDTGLDTDHQSVDNGAFLHALDENAKRADTDPDDYLASLNLLDAAEIQSLLPQLNIYKGYNSNEGKFIEDKSLTGENLHLSDKVAFAYNYVDRDHDVTHDHDAMTGHGSHVAGIAAANRFVPEGDGYAPALDTVKMQGVAPDAQLMVMKVFGKSGGAYDSDYMAAIEDALVLGADAINLSLGSTYPGFATNDTYQAIFDSLEDTDTVISISAGNSHAWPEYSTREHLYVTDVNLDTVGSPGSYANALTVASVNNCGTTGFGFQVAGQTYSYYENALPTMQSLAALDTTGAGTEYEYIFMDYAGNDYEYEDALYYAENRKLFEGKIVIVSRGEINFTEKHMYAEEFGAAALVVYNNEPGPLGMILDGSKAKIPGVSVTQDAGAAIRASSEEMLDAYGDPMEGYYTGKLTVSSAPVTVLSGAAHLEMSDFSSWGVPGSLTLKPEITTPGGNIYSIDGESNATNRYVSMGGTSMAAPHAAGLAALYAQYLRETGLAEKLGISPRHLTQSLLMSTATPIVDGESGNPYPVIRQGAGLANVANAMAAQSYVTVAGQADGKVKAELGDDPGRTGVYTFDYTLHNMTQAAQPYTLDAQVYTQAWFEDAKSTHFPEGEKDLFMDYAMTKLNAGVAYAVNGREVLPESGGLENCDFNGDQTVNEADGQALLDYAVGKRDALSNPESADLSGDGNITAYDAELFLARLGSCVVTLPAGGELTVSVTITLPEDVKQTLDAVYPNGAYIEAYVTAAPFATPEGVALPAHSIPVLAFYGGWDEPSMFDSYTHTQLMAGINEHDSYIPAGLFTNSDFNRIVMAYGDAEGYYIMGGNAFAKEDRYLPERNAIRSNAGDAVVYMQYLLIRGAGKLRGIISNADTGERYGYEELDRERPTYFDVNAGGWDNALQWILPGAAEGENWGIVDNDGKPLPDGTHLEFLVQAAPEYCLKADGSVDWDSLDRDGTAMSLPVTVDNTAPVLKQVSQSTVTDVATGVKRSYVDVTARDNQYIAAVLLTSPEGTKVLVREAANQEAVNEETTVRLDITGVFGSAFQLVVVDYAGNASTYDIVMDVQNKCPTATLYGPSNDYYAAQWHAFSSDSNFDYTVLAETTQNIQATAYGDGYLFYVGNSQGEYMDSLYVVDYPGFDNPVRVGEVDGVNRDLAYNPDDGTLYFVKNYKYLWSMDAATAETALVGELTTPLGNYEASGLAYSEREHCFYATACIYQIKDDKQACPTGLFKFTLPADGSETIAMERVADFGDWPTYSSTLVLDEEQNAAFIGHSNNLDAVIYTYQFDGSVLTLTGQNEKHGTFFLPKENEENGIVRTQPLSASMNLEETTLFVGERKTLAADVAPWCLSDKSVTWRSSDETVAAVSEDGQVSGLGAGTAVITAASLQDETVTASCTVTVIGDSFTFRGIGTGTDGVSRLLRYDLSGNSLSLGDAIVDAAGSAVSVDAVSDDAHTGDLWVRDSQTDETGRGYRLHTVDPATGKSGFDSEASAQFLSDMVYDSWNSVLVGVNNDGRLYFSENPEANDVSSNGFNLESRNLLAVARGETGYNDRGAKNTRLYILDGDNNRIIRGDLYLEPYFGSWTIYQEYYPINEALSYVADENGRYQETLIRDEATGALLLFHYTEDGTQVIALNLDETTDSYNAISLGKLEGCRDAAIYASEYSGQVSAGESEITLSGEQLLLTAGDAQGATNAAAEAPDRAKDGIVTVTLRAEEDAASGMLTIALDKNATLVGLESPAALSAYTEKDGRIAFAYAGTDTIAKGEAIATLRVKLNAQKSAVTVTETERGGKALEKKTTVTLRNACDGKTDCPSAAFTDLNPSAWYHEYTDYVLETGLMNGVGNNKFAPNNTVTRAMVVTMLYRLAGEPEVKNAAPFKDVSADQWYAKAVAWAYENDVVKGVTADLFRPNAPATREQLVTFLYRYAKFAGMDTNAKGDLKTFTDGATVSDYAKESVSWAVGAGLLNGFENGKLLPKNTATRAQLATVFCRFAK